MSFFDKLKQMVAGAAARRRSSTEKRCGDERSGGFYQPLPRQQPGSISRILCWKCGAANPPGTSFCRRCETALTFAGGASSRCMRCGAVLSAKAGFCDECGERR